MKALKIFSLLACPFIILSSCKKEKAESYYYGEWDIRENQYTSPDTSYTDEVAPGINTYDFHSDNSVDITSLGTTTIMDSWQLVGNHDSIRFGNHPSWKIMEKNPNSFRAKFYLNANTHMTIRLER